MIPKLVAVEGHEVIGGCGNAMVNSVANTQMFDGWARMPEIQQR